MSMDRMTEYYALLEEPLPSALEDCVDRAQRRHRGTRMGRRCGIPVAALGGVAAAFILLVNTSVPFARACGSVPFLKDLAVSVAFSPSLKAAVEHEHVQSVGAVMEENGITLNIEYIIADPRQVNIFYTLTDEAGEALYAEADIAMPDGARMESVHYGGATGGEDGELRTTTVDFFGADAPGVLRFTLEVWRGGFDTGTPAATFTADLTLDPVFAGLSQVVELNRTVELEGQTLVFRRVEVYPTHVRIAVSPGPGNTAALEGLKLALVDGEGRRVEGIRNGISASGVDSGETAYHLESSYFWNAQSLTLEIAGATWLDAGRETATLDIASGTADGLPEGVTLGAAVREGGSVRVSLIAPTLPGGGMYSVQGNVWLDGNGEKHDINSISALGGRSTFTTQDGLAVSEGYFCEEIYLLNCPWDRVELTLAFTRRSTYEDPVRVTVR